jgi:hypothetical protein
LSKAVDAAVDAAEEQHDAACLSYEQLLQVLQSLPISDYSGEFEAACRALLEAMRAGDNPERVQALRADVCFEVSTLSSTGLAGICAYNCQQGFKFWCAWKSQHACTHAAAKECLKDCLLDPST